MQELIAKQDTTLWLTPLLDQSFKILQMDQLNLQQYLEKIALENPLIQPEVILSQPEHLDQFRVHRPSKGIQESANYNLTIEDIPDARDYGGLLRYISFQINILYSGKERKTIEFLAGFLDENGYLCPDFDSICRESSISVGELRQALVSLQSLDPPGIGASNLAECLLLQLNPTETLERRLIEGYLTQIAYGDHRKLSKELGISYGCLQKALKRIRSLNPRPGSNYTCDFMTQYIVPDIIANWNCQGELEISLNSSRQLLQPVQEYMNLRRETKDLELKNYLNKMWEQLSYLQCCLEKRDKTLLKLGEIIALYQERFFRYGPSALSCFYMKDAAEIMGVHKSTISRAVSGKYLTCDYGTFPLKYFFVRSLHPEDPNISSIDVKQQIISLIRKENPNSPYSDAELAVKLSKRGIYVARRTITKYRVSLGIPNSLARERKGFSNI